MTHICRLTVFFLLSTAVPCDGSGTLWPHDAAITNQAFDVISVKVSNDPGESTTVGYGKDDFKAINVSIEQLLGEAYSLRRDQIVGLPSWTRTARYDVRAKLLDQGAIAGIPMQYRNQLLRPLLFARFGLSVHETSVLRKALVMKMVSVSPNVLPSSGEKFTVFHSVTSGGVEVGNSHFVGNGIPMVRLTDFLSRRLQQTVLDGTGLKGNYRIYLDWSVGGSEDSERDQSSVLLIAALKEQAGMSLHSERVTVPVLVVDKVLPPEPD